jgi:hypothetical protein
VIDSNFDLVVASRLEDIASQVEKLYAAGMIKEATLLRNEGLEMAEAYDDGTTFLYINDLTEA